LGQQVFFSFDKGAGLKLMEEGPNYHLVCWAWCSPWYEERDFIYDGLGRSVGRKSSIDLGYAYATQLVQQSSYSGLTGATNKTPLDWSGSRWTAERETYDGLGRLVKKQISRDGQTFAPPNPMSSEDYSYLYDVRGRVVSMTAPDPSAETSATVTYSFNY